MNPMSLGVDAAGWALPQLGNFRPPKSTFYRALLYQVGSRIAQAGWVAIPTDRVLARASFVSAFHDAAATR